MTPPPPPDRAASLSADLIAVIAAVTTGDPRVLTIADGAALPSGQFESRHRSLQTGLRAWVERQTHQPLGYIEQLYTFADRDRARDGRVISVSYLGLALERDVSADPGAGWQSWYRYFPWEDHRAGPPAILEAEIAPALLQRWARDAGARLRARAAFGLDGSAWNEELVLQRYELLYEAGMVAEAVRDGAPGGHAVAGMPMLLDHRRILATGIARLRAKIKYRPVVFEVMPQSFTLLELQRTMEALAGRRLHKQNFRRLIDAQALVEETGGIVTETGGRPAKLFRFRREVQEARALAGTKLPLAR